MLNYDLVADRLDVFVHKMFDACQALTPKPHQYCVFCDMDEKNPAWIICIFFQDVAQLQEAIRSSVCYQIHEYMWGNLHVVDEFKDLDTAIFFEHGNLPKGDNEVEIFVEASFKKLERLKKEAEEANPKTCSLCDHDFADHRAVRVENEENEKHVQGWMMCIHEHCTCFRTMSFHITDQ